jgi:hypothetical protein
MLIHLGWLLYLDGLLHFAWLLYFARLLFNWFLYLKMSLLFDWHLSLSRLLYLGIFYLGWLFLMFSWFEKPGFLHLPRALFLSILYFIICLLSIAYLWH